MQKRIEKQYQNAEKKAFMEQNWDSYYYFRAIEFDIIKHFVNPFLQELKKHRLIQNKKMRLAEVGAGNAFLSYLWSKDFDEVISTDLEEESIKTHSLGKSIPQQFIQKVGVKNVIFVSSSAINLPFPDESVDVVFSSYVFEHIPIHARGKALHEMIRILKPQGLIINVVPGFIERLTNPFWFYPYLIKRICVKGITKLRLRVKEPGEALIDEEKENSNKKKDSRSFLKVHPHFPFPEPHGEYGNSLQELLYQFPGKWKVLFENNRIDLVQFCSTIYISFNSLSILFGNQIAAKIFDVTSRWTKKYGASKLIRCFGHGYLYLYQKNSLIASQKLKVYENVDG